MLLGASKNTDPYNFDQQVEAFNNAALKWIQEKTGFIKPTQIVKTSLACLFTGNYALAAYQQHTSSYYWTKRLISSAHQLLSTFGSQSHLSVLRIFWASLALPLTARVSTSFLNYAFKQLPVSEKTKHYTTLALNMVGGLLATYNLYSLWYADNVIASNPLKLFEGKLSFLGNSLSSLSFFYSAYRAL